MFCVECGKDGPIFREGVCVNCYLKTHNFTKGPDFIDLPVCSHCNSYKYKNNWTSELFGDVLKKVVKQNFQISKELKKVDINSVCKEINQGMSCKIYISGLLDDVEVTEEHNLSVRLKKTVCDVCSKKFGGYHEAIIQIRAEGRKLNKKELNNIDLDIQSNIENLVAKGNRNVFITDSTIEHGGLDYYLSDKNTAMVIAKKIQDQYGGEFKQSSKNIGMKDGRQLYRTTYLIRLPSIKKDDFIKLNNKAYQIKNIFAQKVKIVDLETSNEITIGLKDIQKASIIGGKEIIKEMILVSQTDTELQVMNENNYNIKIVKKPKRINFKTEKIKTVTIEGKTFLLSD